MITIGTTAVFGSGYDINESNLLLPNNCIYWKVIQGNEDFVRCVTVRDSDGIMVREESIVVEAEPHYGERRYELGFTSNSYTYPDGWTLQEIASGSCPLHEPILAWVDTSQFVRDGDPETYAWTILTVERTGGEFMPFALRKEDGSGYLPIDHLTYNSMRWCKLPPEQNILEQ